MSTLSYFVTTVLTPAVTNNLADVATVLDDWGIPPTESAFITRTVARCSAAAMDYCNRDFGIAKYKIVARLERGYRDGHLTLGNASPIMIPYWPLSSILSVTETDEDGQVTTLVENTDYEVDYQVGKFYRLDSFGRQRDWWPRMIITITCWAGYVMPGQNAGSYPGAQLLPEHLQDAIGRMVAARYFQRGRDPFIRSEVIEGIGRTDYIVDTNKSEDNGNLSPDVADILNNFRQPVLA